MAIAYAADPERVSRGPNWLEWDRFDMFAKVPVNPDALRPMLRTLLVDRFHFLAHTEERPTNAYTLVAHKPQLMNADPASRTKCQEG